MNKTSSGVYEYSYFVTWPAARKRSCSLGRGELDSCFLPRAQLTFMDGWNLEVGLFRITSHHVHKIGNLKGDLQFLESMKAAETSFEGYIPPK